MYKKMTARPETTSRARNSKPAPFTQRGSGGLRAEQVGGHLMNTFFSNRTGATRLEHEAEAASMDPKLQVFAGAIAPGPANSSTEELGEAVSHHLTQDSSAHVPRDHNTKNIQFHHDDAAFAFADMFKARAVTIDNNVYFSKGQFRPSDRRGQELIVHEVAHGVQDRPRDSAHRSGPDDWLNLTMAEEERKFVDHIMNGRFDECNEMLRHTELATKLALRDTITRTREVAPFPAWDKLDRAERLIQAWIDDPGQFDDEAKPAKNPPATTPAKAKSKPSAPQTQSRVDDSTSQFTQAPDTVQPPTYLELYLQNAEDMREASRNIAANADRPSVAQSYDNQLFHLREQEAILHELMDIEVKKSEVNTELKEVESKIAELKQTMDTFDEGYSTRRECLLAGGSVCQVYVAPHPGANGSAPRYEAPRQYPQNLNYQAASAARQHGLEPDLVKAIMFMETTHGYYDKIVPFDMQKSVLPMNINDDFWGDEFGTREQLNEPAHNIDAGAEMLARIVRMLPADASVAQIATLYNNINAKKVTDYGARVEKIYKDKLFDDSELTAGPRDKLNEIAAGFATLGGAGYGLEE